jgi:hypothetical protein
VKLVAAFVLLAAAAVSPDIRYFQYQRPVENAPQNTGQNTAQTCIALDAALFAHAAPGLADLRLYRDRQETPYVMHMSSPATAPEQAIQLLNLGARGGQTVFDAAMPDGSYSDLDLNVRGHDFIATATVTGSQQQAGPATKVGDYTLFDLTRQRLGRSTVLHLPPSDFRYLHFRIHGPLRPEAIAGLSVQQLPSGEPAYGVVAESNQVRLKDHASVIEFTVPVHVPVDRIAVVPGATPANFSRDATIEVRPMVQSPSGDSAEPPAPMVSTGNLLRVHTVEDNHRIDQEHLELDAPGANFDWPSKWTITIDNGDNAPLTPASVRLEMVKRSLCFEAAGGKYTLYYGDARLSAPRYDLGQFLVVHVKDAAQAAAGPEQKNPEYQARPDDRPFTERHPLLLWVALALVVILLGGIALRTAKMTGPQQS